MSKSAWQYSPAVDEKVHSGHGLINDMAELIRFGRWELA